MGLAITFGLIFADKAKVGGLHAGSLAALFNWFVGVGGSYLYNAFYSMADEAPPAHAKESDLAHKDHPEIEALPESRDADAVVDRVARRQALEDTPPFQPAAVSAEDAASKEAAPGPVVTSAASTSASGEVLPAGSSSEESAIRRMPSLAGDGKPRMYTSLQDLLYRRHDEPRQMVDGDFPHQRWYVWAMLLVPLLFQVPFYRTPGAQDEFIGGLPSWAFVATFFSWVVAVGMAISSFCFWPTPLEELEAAAREKQEAADAAAAGALGEGDKGIEGVEGDEGGDGTTTLAKAEAAVA